MPTLTNVRYKGRTDTEANWISSNPILLEGEPAYSSDKNHRYKIGDGHSHWNELEYSGYKIGANLTVDDDDVTVSVTKENVVNALGYTPPKTDTTYTNATIQSAGLMSAADKAKLNTIEEGANHYTHPSYLARRSGFYKVTVDDEGHVSGVDNVVKNDITALGIPSQDTTYSNATTSLDGLLSSEDKTKLDGIASGATRVLVDSSITERSSNPVRSSAIYSALAGKVPTSRTVNGKALSGNITLTANDVKAIPSSSKGANNGVAELDSSGKVPSSQLPSYVDDVIEGYLSGGKFYKESEHTTGIVGETGKIYVNLSDGKTYRWSGSAYVEISASLALGETSSTAYRGDRGAIAYNHSQTAHAPSNAERNIIVGIKKNGSTVSIGSDRTVNITVPTKVSELTNDSGYKTTDNNTTYTLKKDGNTITLTGSDGSKSNVTDANTTYSVASTSTNGLMSASDKTKLDGISSGANRYTHPSYTARSSGLYKVTVDSTGHVSATSAVTKSDITALGIPGQDTNTWTAFKGASSTVAGTSGYVPGPSAGSADRYFRSDGTWAVPPNTTYSVATTSTAGLMSASDKTKLDGIATGANKYTHPSYTARSSGLYKVTVDAQGHVSATSPVTKSDITALGIPGQDTNTTYTLGSFGISATAAEINKLDGLTATTAELNYVDGVTSNIQTQLNGKSPTTHSHSAATTKANGFMSSSDKTKLDGIASGANKYTHPSYTARSSGLYKVTVDSQGHVSSVSNVTKSDITNLGIPGQDTNTWTAFKGATTSTAGTAGYVPAPSAGSATRYFRSDGTWAVPPNTTYSVASTSANGLMSASDKTKLDGIASGANRYVHPSYTAKSSGLYKVTVDSTGHVKATSAVTKADITALGIPGQDTNTTYTLGSFGITATATEINKLDGLTATTAELNYVDGVTSNIQTQLNGKLSTSGTAAAATKLATGRSIGLSTAVSATTQTFDGTGNITIPVNGVKEAYLEWGGRSMSGGFGPLDASLIPELGANRLAFMPASAIEIQYSTNGGSTWATYPSVTDTAKINLFNGNISNFYIGANSSSGVTKDNYQLRIIFTSNIAKVYTALQKFAIYLSTQGSKGSWCTIDAITKANVDAGKDTWTTFANKVPVAGWSGWNIINVSSLTTYWNNSSQYQKVRFTFGVTSHSSSSQYPGLVVNKILGFGGMGWQIPSTMAGTGRMYTYDASQNVTFPANVKATKFQGATASTSEAGLMSAADKTKLDGIATGANKYTHPSYTAKSSGLYKITVDSSGHVSATTAVSKSDITALGIPGQDTNTTYSAATTSTAGLMSAADKTKLNGIATGANNYVHPTSAGYKHIPSGGSSGQILEYSASGTAKWSTPTGRIACSATQPTNQQIGDFWIKLE